MDKKLPKFNRIEYFRYKKLKHSWRRPRGSQNKVRKGLTGKMITPAIGFGSKRTVRGLHPSGFKEILIENKSQLEGLDNKAFAVRISGKVSKRTKSILVEEAKKFDLKVLNPGLPAKEE